MTNTIVGMDGLGAGVDSGWCPYIQQWESVSGLECGGVGPALGGDKGRNR